MIIMNMGKKKYGRSSLGQNFSDVSFVKPTHTEKAGLK